MIKELLSVLFRKKNSIQKPEPASLYTTDILGSKPFIGSIGAFTYGHPKVYYWGEDAKLTIGNYCSLADGVTLVLGGNHRADWVTTFPFGAFDQEWNIQQPILGHPATKGNITIGNDVWIATGVVILSGITIGDGAVIGANALVAKDVPPYAVVVGNPGKVIKKRFPDNVIHQLLDIAWWNWEKEKINANIHLLCQENIDEFIRIHRK